MHMNVGFFNWIDWLIVAALAFEVFQGWETGLFSLGASFLSLAGAMWLALTFHTQVSSFLSQKFGIASVWGNVFGFIGIAIFSQIIVGSILYALLARLPEAFLKSKMNSWLGAVLSLINGFLVVTFILLVILALPLRGTVKNDIKASTMGGYLVKLAERYAGSIETTMNEVGQQASQFMTIDPNSSETLSLDVTPAAADLKEDVVDERLMVTMVNAERIAVGAQPLTVNDELTNGARAHSRDMFMRRYFAHNSPDGQTPGDRIHAAGITFTDAGENLAYAPDVNTAHRGLMNSPEHKKNILDPAFHRIGIGIISTDSYGLMVTQDFAN